MAMGDCDGIKIYWATRAVSTSEVCVVVSSQVQQQSVER